MYVRLAIAAGILAILAAVLWFTRAPIIAAAKEWRSNSLISKSESLLEKGRGRDAAQSAMAAWQLGPRKLPTIRRLMHLGRKVGLPELSGVTLVVYFHEDHTAEDRLGILRWTIDRGDVPFFDQLYANLGEELREGSAVRLLYARKLGLQGRLLEAIEEARGLEGNEELAAEVSLLLAALLSRLPDNPVAVKQASERLRELLDEEEEGVALRAWRTMRTLPKEHRDPGADFDPVAWVESREDTGAGDRVLARRILVERLPEEGRDVALRDVARDFVGDPEAVGWVVRWYLEEGHGKYLLELPESSFLEDSAMFSSRLQVLLETERFTEAEAWLAKAPQGFPEGVAGSLRAVFARKAGKPNEALSAWRRVIDRASSLQLYGDCISILRIAEKFGEEKAAEEIVNVIVSFPPGRLPASESLEFLEPYFAARPDEWLRFWRAIFRNRPGDGFAAEQVSFLELLEPDEVESAVVLQRTESLLNRFPGSPRLRATHALWLLSSGRAEDSLETLRKAEVNWNDTDPTACAVYVLVLRRTGAAGEATALEASIRWNRIGPVRRSILASFFQAGRDPERS